MDQAPGETQDLPWAQTVLHNSCGGSRSLDTRWLLRDSPAPPHPPGVEVISPDLPFYDFLWFSGRATVNVLDYGSCYFSATHFQALLGVQSKGKSWCAIDLESGAVISLRAHVRTPGLQGQAVNPALGDTRSISCYILSAEGGPHKCLFNSQLIHNNAAGPAKSTKMKKCETIKLKFLGWWQGWKGFRETMCFLS